MRETLKMMKSIITGKEKETNEKELIKKYQNELCPNILAYFYCNNYTLILQLSEHFELLQNEDKASFCLQELDNCLLNYNFNTKNKFITYFIRCYKNRLITESKKLNTNINKINQFCNELKDIKIVKNDIDIEDYTIIFNDYKLSNDECILCNYLLEGYTKKEIAILLKISNSMVSQRILKLKKKIRNFT